MNFWKKLWSSEPLHSKINPTSCLFGSRYVYLQTVILSVMRILSSFSMLWAILYYYLDYGILYPSPDPNYAGTLQRQNAENLKQIFPEKASVPICTFKCLWANYIFPRWVCLFCWRKYVDRSWEYINRWHWGRAIPRKGIYKRNCLCSVPIEQEISAKKV